jgi:outer membrane protein OmpA-like peptidoglycan-associated protein
MMVAPESARRSGGVAHVMPAGLRTTLAAVLLVIGVADLAAIDTVLVPRYLASRSRGARDSALVPLQARAQPTTVLPPQPTPVVSPPVLAAAAQEPATPPPAPEEVPAPPTTAAHPEAEPAPKAVPSQESDWPRLLFVLNSAWLSSESRETLDKLAAHLKDNPGLQVVLGGHTDDSGTPELNHSLSFDRAVRAQKWLVGKGVDPVQIEVHNFGASRPATPGRSAEARAQNRRVEIALRERSH